MFVGARARGAASRCAALSVVVMLGACARDEEPEPGEDCVAEAPPDPAALPTRTVALGGVEDDVFTEWQPDQAVPIVWGSQGFAMLTPWLELPMQPGDVDRACWHVSLEHVTEGAPNSDGLGGTSGGMIFEIVGDRMRAGPIFDILEGDDPLELRVTVSTAEWVAVDQVRVMPT